MGTVVVLLASSLSFGSWLPEAPILDRLTQRPCPAVVVPRGPLGSLWREAGLVFTTASGRPFLETYESESDTGIQPHQPGVHTGLLRQLPSLRQSLTNDDM